MDGITVVDMSGVEYRLDTLQGTAQDILGCINHPAMVTPFENYTVTEAVLTLLLVIEVIKICWRLVKGGFSWLW